MTVSFTAGLAGGLVGFLAASGFVLRWFGVRGAGALFSQMLLASGIAAAVVAAVVAGLWHTRDLLSSNSLPPELVFEIRLPSGIEPPPLVSRAQALARRSPVELRTPENTMSAEINSVREEAGSAVFAGRVEMHYRVSARLLAVRLSGAPEAVFRLDLRRNPAATANFGPWRPDDTGQNFHIRYRVHREGD